MNERERWIVYPLLFFALGSALRDKFLQHVSTKDLECQQLVAKQIICQDLLIRDPTKRDRIVARLSSDVPSVIQEGQTPDAFGVLQLIDSEGKDLCTVTNQVLSVREMSCLALKVVDPENQSQVLAALTTAAVASPQPGGRPQRFGVLALNNQKFGQLMGNPPPNPRDVLPANQEEVPADPDAEGDASNSGKSAEFRGKGVRRPLACRDEAGVLMAM